MEATAEEFAQMIEDMKADLANPDGEFAAIRKEFDELYNSVAPHDQKMANCLSGIMYAYEQLAKYVEQRP